MQVMQKCSVERVDLTEPTTMQPLPLSAAQLGVSKSEAIHYFSSSSIVARLSQCSI